jgi:hypothetical protein
MNINRRRLLASISGVGSIGLAGCSNDDNTSTEEPDTTNSCSDAEFELIRVVEIDASTVDLVIRNRSGDEIKPDKVTVTRSDGEQFTRDIPFGTSVDQQNNLSVKVEINSAPNSIANVVLDYYDSTGNSFFTDVVCTNFENEISESSSNGNDSLNLQWDGSSVICDPRDQAFEVNGTILNYSDEFFSSNIIWVCRLTNEQFRYHKEIGLSPANRESRDQPVDSEDMSLQVPFDDMTEDQRETACNLDEITFEIYTGINGNMPLSDAKLLKRYDFGENSPDELGISTSVGKEITPSELRVGDFPGGYGAQFEFRCVHTVLPDEFFVGMIIDTPSESFTTSKAFSSEGQNCLYPFQIRTTDDKLDEKILSNSSFGLYYLYVVEENGERKTESMDTIWEVEECSGRCVYTE